MLRYLTAGESHGQALVAIVEGVPSGLPLHADDIDRDLARRQVGYGRGERMKIESDTAILLAGVRHGFTLGSPVAVQINNRDWPNWQEKMNPAPVPGRAEEQMTRPRPGHADLVGSVKYNHTDIRHTLERASARETATRVVVGALARRLLAEFGVSVHSRVIRIGSVQAPSVIPNIQVYEKAELCPVRCGEPNVAEQMCRVIDAAKQAGDSVGGVFEVAVFGLPPGLGSYVHPDRKLDGRLAMSLMSIQAIKGVEIGMGFQVAQLLGSQVHDGIAYHPASAGWGYYRPTNNAGGIEGGMTNGEPLVVRAAMKPIATLYKPLASIDMHTKEPSMAGVERSDTCAVPAAAVVGEAAVAWELAVAFLEKLGGDNMQEITLRYRRWQEELMHV